MPTSLLPGYRTHSAGSIVFARSGRTLIIVRLTVNTIIARNTMTGVEVNSILYRSTWLLEERAYLYFYRQSEYKTTRLIYCYREIIRQLVVHDSISDSIQVWSSMQWLSCLLTVQVPPFKQGLEAQSSMFVSQLYPINPGGHVQL